MLYLNILFIVVFSLYLYWIWGLLRALKSPAPYVPMRPEVVRALVALAEPKQGSIWVDLGSGDGRVLIEACRRYDVKGIGIERIGALRLLSRLTIWAFGLGKRIEIRRGDFFKTDLTKADVVSFYLLPVTSQELIPKLRRELRPGAQILYHRFPIPGIVAEEKNSELKLYRAVAPF